MAKAPADGTPIAHRVMRDLPVCLGHDWTVCKDFRRLQHRVVRRQRTDPQLVAGQTHVLELVKSAYIDQALGRSQTKIEHGKETLPAGEHLGPVAEICERCQGGFRIGRPLIVKRWRLHRLVPPLLEMAI